MRGPTDKTRSRELLQAEAIRCARLSGIRRDDFQIVFLAKRKKGVARATPGMDAAERCAYAGGLFDEGDAFVEIAAAKKDVVEHSGHVRNSPSGHGRGERASCQSQK